MVVTAYTRTAIIVHSDAVPFCTDAAYLYKCPDRLRLPLVFYVAHPASVYINKLLLAGMIEVSDALL